jgi:hypothetical protein
MLQIVGLTFLMVMFFPAFMAPVRADVTVVDGQQFLKEFQQKFSPFEEFALVVGRFYQTHQRWPQDTDLGDLKSAAQEMKAFNPRIDLDKYSVIHFEELSGGNLKVKYILKSDPATELELTLQKPA